MPGRERNGHVRGRRLDAIPQGGQARADVRHHVAGLLRRDFTRRQLLDASQQVGQQRQFLLPVPGVQAREFAAHFDPLAVGQTKVAVEPPVRQVGQGAVAELERAARGKHQRKGEHKDNAAEALGD